MNIRRVFIFPMESCVTEQLNPYICISNRGVSERSKEHAWKVCIRQKRIEGSNPFPSAKPKERHRKWRSFGFYGGCGTDKRVRTDDCREVQAASTPSLFLGYWGFRVLRCMLVGRLEGSAIRPKY
jgi:hypothetical protein